MDKQDRLFYQRLKKIQKEHTPEKYERRKPYPWKKEWGPFVKYDGDWDGCFLLDTIIYKIEKMRLAFDIYSYEVREDLEKRLASMDQAIALGKKLQTHDYNKNSYDWNKEHCAHVILIYKKGHLISKEKPLHKILKWHKKDNNIDLDEYFGKKEVNEWIKANGYTYKDIEVAYTGEWDSEQSSKTYKSMLREEEKKRQKDYDDFFKIIAKNIQGWWY